MVHPHIFAVVKAIRLRYAVLFIVLLVVVYMLGIHPCSDAPVAPMQDLAPE